MVPRSDLFVVTGSARALQTIRVQYYRCISSSRISSSRPTRPGGRACRPRLFPTLARSIVGIVENRQKSVLGNLDVPHLFHTLLALLLLFEQFPFSCNVSAVTLCGHILAQGRDRLAGDHTAANGRLDGNLELVPDDSALQLPDQFPTAPDGMAPVHDLGKGIDLLARYHDVESTEIAGSIADQVIVHGAVAAGGALQLVVQVVNHLRQGKLIAQKRPGG